MTAKTGLDPITRISSTTAGFTSTAATSHPPKLRTTTTLNKQPSRPLSSHTSKSPDMPGRFTVQMDFTLGPDQRGPNEPDLDNLIKAAVDSLDGVLGIRAGTGQRVEADDVLVDRIIASKRHARPGEQPGAQIRVSTSKQNAM